MSLFETLCSSLLKLPLFLPVAPNGGYKFMHLFLPPVWKASLFITEAEGWAMEKLWSSTASDPDIHEGSFAPSTPELWVTGPLLKLGPC